MASKSACSRAICAPWVSTVACLVTVRAWGSNSSLSMTYGREIENRKSKIELLRSFAQWIYFVPIRQTPILWHGCEDGWRLGLEGPGRLASGNGTCPRGLFRDTHVPARRALWAHSATAKVRSVDSVEHCGGTWSEQQERVCTVLANRSWIAQGAGNSTSPLPRLWIPSRGRVFTRRRIDATPQRTHHGTVEEVASLEQFDFRSPIHDFRFRFPTHDFRYRRLAVIRRAPRWYVK